MLSSNTLEAQGTLPVIIHWTKPDCSMSRPISTILLGPSSSCHSTAPAVFRSYTVLRPILEVLSKPQFFKLFPRPRTCFPGPLVLSWHYKFETSWHFHLVTELVLPLLDIPTPQLSNTIFESAGIQVFQLSIASSTWPWSTNHTWNILRSH